MVFWCIVLAADLPLELGGHGVIPNFTVELT